MKNVSLFEKVKLVIFVVGVLGVLVLALKATQPPRPIVSYESAYEVGGDLNQDLVDSFGMSPDKNIMYAYIPAYSHIYTSRGSPKEMAVTLSLRNIDLKKAVEILQISYFDTKGKLVRKYLKGGYTLGPLETKEIFIQNDDIEGGSGANFVVLFSSLKNTLSPIFETVMAATSDIRSYVFSSRGVIYSGQPDRLSETNL